MRLHLDPWGVGARSWAQRYTRISRRAPPLQIHRQASLDGPSLSTAPYFLRYAYVQIYAVLKLLVESNAIYTLEKANLSQSWLLLFFGEK